MVQGEGVERCGGREGEGQCWDDQNISSGTFSSGKKIGDFV